MGVSRSSTVLWAAADAAGAGDASTVASIGTKPNIVIFIQNVSAGAKTFSIQVAPTLARSAGVNEDLTDAVWHDLLEPDGTVLVISSGDDTAIAYDASPFAAENFRLVSVEGFSAGQIIASATATGDD